MKTNRINPQLLFCFLILSNAVISGNTIPTTVAKRAENPIITHMYTADPTARVWKDGRLYLYPSTDVNPPRGCDLMDER